MSVLCLRRFHSVRQADGGFRSQRVLFKIVSVFPLYAHHLRRCLQGSLDNINLFSVITIISFFLLAPVALLREGFQLSHSGLHALGVVDTNFIFQQALYAALSFHTYQQVTAPPSLSVLPARHEGQNLHRPVQSVAV